MVFSIAWAEGSPPGGSTPADTIDTELQNLKISIRERIEQIIPEWADDAVDPKTLANARGRFSLAANFSVPNNVITAVTWDTEDFTVNTEDDVIDLVGQPTRLTVPADRDGLYHISATIVFLPNATGIRTLLFRKNGAVFSEAGQQDSAPIAGQDSIISCSLDDDLVATDFFEVFAFQNSGGALDLRGRATAGFCNFGMHRIPGS